MSRSIAAFLACATLAGTLYAGQPRGFTYSIVARDPHTGEIGVAVQSHWFSVGSVVPWAEAGVGGVATQSIVEASYGPLGIDLMRSGKTAPQALQALLAADPSADVRQVAMVDSKGQVAAHTGVRCIAAAGHVQGEQFSVQANLMVNDRVWPAMAQAYRAATGDLADHLLAALEAAQKEGGDLRGMQSAAIKVVRGTGTGRPWVDTIFDLRVEDHPEPLRELRRLITLQRAYARASAGDELVAANKIEEALREYAEAARLAPDVIELPFWQAVTLASSGRLDESLPIFRRVFAIDPNWAVLVERLPASGFLPADEALMKSILAAAAREPR